MSTAAVRGHRDEDGFTLVELLVAMVITGMVLAMAGSFFVNVTRSAATAKADRVAMAQAALAVDAVRNTVSMASDNPTSSSATTPAIVSATGSSLSLISYANTSSNAIAPSQYTYTLDASGYLTESRQSGVLASNGYWAFSGSIATRQVAGPFVSGATPFFTYIDKTGVQMTVPSTGIATADLPKVAFVRVTAAADSRDYRGVSAPVTVVTTVGLTNVFRDVAASVALPAVGS